MRIEKMNMYLFMLWVEFVAIISFSVASWLRLIGAISPVFAIRLGFPIFLLIQLHFLIQIIINRICILLPHRKQRLWLKYGIAALVLSINISGFPIWLSQSQKTPGNIIYVKSTLNRIEKIFYLVIDAGLNIFLIHLVRSKLKDFGSRKYEPLLRFNMQIIIISLIMDVIVGGTMWFPVDFFYFQTLPVSNLVKLNIEMSLSDLIVALSKESIHFRVPFTDQGNSYNCHIPLESRPTAAITKEDTQSLTLKINNKKNRQSGLGI
ncbi:hypothetical protein NEOLI_004190 [Neolecta irregularis DAH-3]|uniref:Uncharacterized protein n=1 Tax=Neolecta irregularis (strain DAH-3) TaxID=1198029 RepID=A0A1U7LML8_NEOID|nr:hypothetical protein NEOLI_004190 [Neolecta irregularis DAH-3]|eukprot:OLL23889.1 hypothetical protein NEOLI_004190 [Neolecta irregularis DAH-3]